MQIKVQWNIMQIRELFLTYSKKQQNSKQKSNSAWVVKRQFIMSVAFIAQNCFTSRAFSNCLIWVIILSIWDMNHYFICDMTQYLIVHRCVSCRQQRTAVTQPPGTARTSWKAAPLKVQAVFARCLWAHSPFPHCSRAPCVYLSIPFCSNSNLKCQHCHGQRPLQHLSLVLLAEELYLLPPPSCPSTQPPLSTQRRKSGGLPCSCSRTATKELSPPPHPLLVAGEIRQTSPNPIRKSPGLKQNGSSKTLDFM